MKRYHCQICGVISSGHQHLCQGEELRLERSCGGNPEKSAKMCPPTREKATCTCGFCGRPSEQPELLCNPEEKSEADIP